MDNVAQFAAADAAIFAALATDCSVQRGADPGVASRCMVEDGVQQVGEFGRIIGRNTRVSFIKSEWDPARGDIVTIAAKARPIEDIETDDGLIVQAVLHG